MKKNTVFIILLLTFILFPFNNKAICSFENKTKYMELSNNINTTYVFDENTKKFNIIINNIPKNFVIRDVNRGVDNYYKNQELTLTNYEPSKSYIFEVIVNEGKCYETIVKTLYVTLPIYNFNHDDSLCKGLEDYSICSKWGKYISNHNEFVKQINKLNEKIESEDEELVTEEYSGIFDSLIDIFSKTYYIILPIIIIICLIAIYKLNKKDRLF